MTKVNLEIEEEDLRELYDLLGEINHFFHQPVHFSNEDTILKFATENYPRIRELYYQKLWDLLPSKMQQEIENE